MARRKRKDAGAEVEVPAETGAPDEDRQRLTPVDIQQKVFRLAFRGYNERDVDEFLDLLTEDIATLHEENKRLREQVGDGGGSAEAVNDAEQQAETIVREARDHAARLVEEAEDRARALGTREVPVAGVSASFLIREREFLQRLASLVQSHAKGLKEEARKARAAASEPEPQSGSAGPVEPPAEFAPMTPSASPDPGEATAPWGPVAKEPGEVIGEAPPAAWAEAQPEEAQDPLLSAWENAFLSGSRDPEPEDSPRESTVGRTRPERKEDRTENEPSLRELFWGEE